MGERLHESPGTNNRHNGCGVYAPDGERSPLTHELPSLYAISRAAVQPFGGDWDQGQIRLVWGASLNLIVQ